MQFLLVFLLDLQVNLALEIEEKLPWIRRRLKKSTYRVEKYRKIPCCFDLYQKMTNSIFGNSFKELERDVNDLQSEDKLSSLLQGLEVTNCSYCIYYTNGNLLLVSYLVPTYIHTYMYVYM